MMHDDGGNFDYTGGTMEITTNGGESIFLNVEDNWAILRFAYENMMSQRELYRENVGVAMLEGLTGISPYEAKCVVEAWLAGRDVPKVLTCDGRDEFGGLMYRWSTEILK
mgnify:CR=1 FL=1